MHCHWVKGHSLAQWNTSSGSLKQHNKTDVLVTLGTMVNENSELPNGMVFSIGFARKVCAAFKNNQKRSPESAMKMFMLAILQAGLKI